MVLEIVQRMSYPRVSAFFAEPHGRLGDQSHLSAKIRGETDRLFVFPGSR